MKHVPARCYRERIAIERRRRAGGLAACVVAAFTCGLAATAFVSAFVGLYPETHRLIVITETGDRFVAGIGDDCGTAIEGAYIPADWHELKCE